MEDDSGTSQEKQSHVRDWIDPTRIYNTYAPVGKWPYFWGLASYPFIVLFILLTPIIIAIESSSQAANLSDTLGIIIYCFMLGWVAAAVAITRRRLMTLGMSLRWVWLMVLPGVSLILVLVLLFRSAPGEGRA